MMSKGLQWDRYINWPCWVMTWRLYVSFSWTISRMRGLLLFILATIFRPSWHSLSFTIGRQELLWRRLILTYWGSRRQIRIALFWIFCRVPSVASGQWTKQTDPGTGTVTVRLNRVKWEREKMEFIASAKGRYGWDRHPYTQNTVRMCQGTNSAMSSELQSTSNS